MFVIAVVIIIAILVLSTLGGWIGLYLAPDEVERPYIEEVNIGEFREINEQLNLTKYIENVVVDEEGKVVFVEDRGYGKSYRIVEDGGDIKSEEYLKNREEYRNTDKKRLNSTEAGFAIVYVVSFIGVLRYLKG